MLPVSSFRPACAAAGAILAVLSLAACGSSSTSTAASAGAGTSRQGGARRGFLQDPKVVACLKKQGVTAPSFPRRGNGGPPNGQPPSGQPPSGQTRPNRRPDSGQFQKLRAALQKCGVDFGRRPPGGQQPQDQGTTGTSAS